jgi:hypothetical protein
LGVILLAHSSFKKLNIDQTKLKDYIQEFCEQEFTAYNIDDIKPISDNSLQHRCKIDTNGKNLIIDFYFNSDGLDGFIKRLLFDNNRIINKTFDCFTRDQATGQYILQNNIVGCSNTAKAIEEAFNYYSRERHGLMHASGIPESHVVIEDPNIANQKIMEVLAVIERTYGYIVK